MTSEGVTRDFWSMRSDEAGTTPSKHYVLALEHVWKPTNHTGKSAEAETRVPLLRYLNSGGAADATEHSIVPLGNTSDEGPENQISIDSTA